MTRRIFGALLGISGVLLSSCAGTSVGFGAGTGFGGGHVGVGVNQTLTPPPSDTVYEGEVTIVENRNDGKTVVHFKEGVSYQVEGTPNVKPGQRVKIKKTKTGFAVSK